MKMKLVVLALSGIITSSAACAMDVDPSFYVGGEIQTNQYKGQPKNFGTGKSIYENVTGKPVFRKHGDSAGLFIGTQINEYFGVEAGYNIHAKQKTNVNSLVVGNTAVDRVRGSLSAKHRNVYVDLMGYAPLSCDVDLIGSVGAGNLHTKQSVAFTESLRGVNGSNVTVNEKSTKTGVRLGVGVQYKFDENFGARLMVRHQKGNKLVKNVNSAGLGLFYRF